MKQVPKAHQISLYEQARLCRFNDPEVAVRVVKDLTPFIPDDIIESIGSFDGTGYSQSEVVKVKSTCDLLPFLIEPDSLVTLKACLRYVNEGDIHFLVENAEGTECLLNAKEVQPID